MVDTKDSDLDDKYLVEFNDKTHILKNTTINSLRLLHGAEIECSELYYISGGQSFLNIMKYMDKNIEEKINDTMLSKYIDYFKTFGLDIVCKDKCFDLYRISIYNILTVVLYQHKIREITENHRSLIYVDDIVVCKIVNENHLEKIREERESKDSDKKRLKPFIKWAQTFMRFQMILNLAYNNLLNPKYYERINKMENKQEITKAIYDILCGDGISKLNLEYKDLEDYYVDNNVRYMGLLSILKRTARSIINGLPEMEGKTNLCAIVKQMNKSELLDEKFMFFKLNKIKDTNNLIIEKSDIFECYCKQLGRSIKKQHESSYNKYLKYKNKYITAQQLV